MAEEERRRPHTLYPGYDVVPMKDYVDTILEPWAARMREGDITLREYLEAMLNDQKKALIAYADERDRTASAVTDEREKAAQVLAETLTRRFAQVDKALRDHITEQVAMLRLAEQNAEALELARIAGMGERIEAVRRELGLLQAASAEAIAKAELATDKRFASVNEFRAQLTDTISRFLPREVSEAQIAELRKAITDISDRINTMTGVSQGRVDFRTGLTIQTQLLLAVLAIIVTILVANGVFR